MLNAKHSTAQAQHSTQRNTNQPIYLDEDYSSRESDRSRDTRTEFDPDLSFRAVFRRDIGNEFFALTIDAVFDEEDGTIFDIYNFFDTIERKGREGRGGGCVSVL